MMLRGPLILPFCVAALLMLGFLQATAGAGSAQRVYQWTDERGVIHFSQEPPPRDTANVEMRNMPVAPTQPAEPDQAETPGTAGQTPGSGAPVAAPGTPARVEVSKQTARQLDAAVRLFRGTVRNSGGRAARDVYLEIVVTETNQGAECLRAEIDVVPSALAPGATGEFEAEFENPCFYGDTKVEIEPFWEED